MAIQKTQRLSFAMKTTQNHVKKTSLYFHIRGWPGYFGSGHSGLVTLGVVLDNQGFPKEAEFLRAMSVDLAPWKL